MLNSDGFKQTILASGRLFIRTMTLGISLSLVLSVSGCLNDKPKNREANPVVKKDLPILPIVPVVPVVPLKPESVESRLDVQLVFPNSNIVTDSAMHDALKKNCAACHSGGANALNLSILPSPQKYSVIKSRINGSSDRPMPAAGFSDEADRNLMLTWIQNQENPPLNPFDGYTFVAANSVTQDILPLEDGLTGRFTVKLGTQKIDSTLAVNLIVTGRDRVEQRFDGVDVKISETGRNFTVLTVKERDRTAPVLSDMVIKTSNLKQKSVTLTWAPASDNRPVEALRYKVYQSSTSTNFDSIAEIEEHGSRVGEELAGTVLTLNVSHLEPATKYYFNVIVEDLDGNKTAYQKLEVLTFADNLCEPIMRAGSVKNWRDGLAESLSREGSRPGDVSNGIKACFPTEVPKCVERVQGYALRNLVAPGGLDGTGSTIPQKLPPNELLDTQNGSGYWIPDNIEDVAKANGWTTVRYRSRHAGGFDPGTPNLMMLYVPGDKVTPKVTFDRWINFPLPKDYADEASLESLDPSPTIGPPKREAYARPNNFPSIFTMVTQDIAPTDAQGARVPARVYFQKFARSGGTPTFRPESISDVRGGCVSCHPNGLRAISPMGYHVRAGEKSLSEQNWNAVKLINDKMTEAAGNLPPAWGGADVNGTFLPFYRAEFLGPIIGAKTPANSYSRTKEFIMGGTVNGRNFSGCFNKKMSRDVHDIFSRLPGMGPNNYPHLSSDARTNINPAKVIAAMNCEGCHIAGSNSRNRWPLNAMNEQVEFKLLVDQSMPIGAHANQFNSDHTVGESTDSLNSDERMALTNCLEAEFNEESSQENKLLWLKQEACGD